MNVKNLSRINNFYLYRTAIISLTFVGEGWRGKSYRYHFTILLIFNLFLHLLYICPKGPCLNRTFKKKVANSSYLPFRIIYIDYFTRNSYFTLHKFHQINNRYLIQYISTSNLLNTLTSFYCLIYTHNHLFFLIINSERRYAPAFLFISLPMSLVTSLKEGGKH